MLAAGSSPNIYFSRQHSRSTEHWLCVAAAVVFLASILLSSCLSSSRYFSSHIIIIIVSTLTHSFWLCCVCCCKKKKRMNVNSLSKLENILIIKVMNAKEWRCEGCELDCKSLWVSPLECLHRRSKLFPTTLTRRATICNLQCSSWECTHIAHWQRRAREIWQRFKLTGWNSTEPNGRRQSSQP